MTIINVAALIVISASSRLSMQCAKDKHGEEKIKVSLHSRQENIAHFWTSAI